MQESGLGREVRLEARQRLLDAVARGRISTKRLQKAVSNGDAGVAALMREHAAPLSIPAIKPESVPRLPSSALGQPLIARLKTLIKLLHAEGALDEAGLAAISSGSCTNVQLYRVLSRAWARFIESSLASAGLPSALPEGIRTAMSVNATEVSAILGEDRGSNGPLVLEIQSNVIPYCALRVKGEDDRAFMGLLRAFQSTLALFCICHPGDGMLFDYIEEAMSDLEEITTWDASGNPQFDAQEAERMLEGTVMGAVSEASMHELAEHMRYRRWWKAHPPLTPGSPQAVAWRLSVEDTAVAAAYDNILAVIAVMQRLPKVKLDVEYEGPPHMTLLPTGTGIDAWMEEMVNCDLNGDEEPSEARVILRGKAADLGRKVQRVFTEVAAMNYVIAQIESLR